jgi:enediyne core biosynthesis thioesterase
MAKAYEYKHIVGFEETNLVGNVYYANYVLWQGRTRELFLYEHAPDVIEQISSGLALVTVNVSCQYISELFAFDQVIVAMRLKEMMQNRITMAFEYWRLTETGKTLVAIGEQQAACMRREDGKNVPTKIPRSLEQALEIYRMN